MNLHQSKPIYARRKSFHYTIPVFSKPIIFEETISATTFSRAIAQRFLPEINMY